MAMINAPEQSPNAVPLWARVQKRAESAIARAIQPMEAIAPPSGGTLQAKAYDAEETVRSIAIIPGLVVSPGDRLLVLDVAGHATAVANLTSAATPAGGTALPDQAGHAGEFLTTDGSTLSWDAVVGGGGAFSAYNANTLIEAATTKLRAWEGIVATLAASGDVRFSANFLTSGGGGGINGTSSAVSREDHIQTLARGGTGATDAAGARAALGLSIGTNVQAWDVFLDQIAALTDPNADRILFWDDSLGAFTWLTLGTNLTITGTTLDAAGGGGVAVQEDTTPVVTATTIQAWEGLLATNPSGSIARITVLFAGSGGNFGTASSVARSDHLHAQADIANLVTDLSNKQPLDADLTTIAGLTATTDNVIQSVAGVWASRTPAQLKTTLALAKGDVGLGNVDNTADTAKPVSTAQQTALDLKLDKAWQKGGRVTPAQTFTANTATNITGMSFTVSAGEIWQFEFCMFVGVNNTGGVKFTFTCPTGYGLQSEAYGDGSSLTTVVFSRMDTAGTLSATFHTFNAQTGMVKISGTLTNTGGGTLQLQGAAGTNGQTVTINAGSYFIAHRIA